MTATLRASILTCHLPLPDLHSPNRRSAPVPHEIHEQIEHAGHDSSGSRLPQFIGITIAILGVLMALCSAQVGAARTELIATMVEESAAKAKYTAVSNKYRNLQAQLQQLHAAMPDLDYLKAKNGEIKALDAEVKNPDLRLSLKAAALNTEKILNTVTPTEKDVERFLGLIDRTRAENEAARHWSESFRDAVKVHENTADRFELALLCAEIGIVIASVGLLLSRQRLFASGAWGIAIVLGVLSASTAVATKINNNHALHGAEDKIHTSEHHFATMNKDEADIAEDKKLEQDIREEFKEMKKLTTGS
jgi:hypothetical protein